MGVRELSVFGLFVILLGFSFVAPYQSAFAGPSISVSPSSGIGNKEVTATLSGFHEDYGVNVLWRGPVGLSTLAGSCPPDNPNCSVSFKGPAVPEVYRFHANSGFVETATTEFTVLKPTATFSPRCGSVGTTVNVNVRDGLSESFHLVRFDTTNVVLELSDVNGNIQTSFQVPSTSEGRHDVFGLNSNAMAIGLANFWVGECLPGGIITELVGDATLVKPDGTELPLTIGDVVDMGDMIKTSSNGSVNTMWNDGSTTSMSKDSVLGADEFIISASEEDSSFLSFLKGDFIYTSIPSFPEPEKQISTPAGHIGIRGTELISDFDEILEIGTIHLIDGTIDLTPKNSVTTHEFTGPITIVFDNLVILDTFPLTQEEYDALKEQISPAQNTAPEITAPSNVIAECTEFGGATGVVLGTPSVIDLEDNDLPPTNDAVEPFALGDTTVTWTVEDTEGLSDSDEQKVTVQDTTNPDLTIPADMTVIATDGQWTGDLGVATATDICDDTILVSNNSVLPLGLGENVITWTADDGFNQPTDDQTITVITAGDATDNLIEKIKTDDDIPKNVKSSLLGPLKKVSKILNDGNPDNDPAACDKLTTFLDNLTAKVDKIDDDGLVDELESDAQAIKDAIGCPLV